MWQKNYFCHVFLLNLQVDKVGKSIIDTFTTMTKANILRFGIIGLLWLGLCYYILTHVPRIDFMTLFSIVASGIIIFVPLYKKYVKNADQNK